jgi:hypothetical protein
MNLYIIYILYFNIPVFIFIFFIIFINYLYNIKEFYLIWEQQLNLLALAGNQVNKPHHNLKSMYSMNVKKTQINKINKLLPMKLPKEIQTDQKKYFN